MFRGACFIRKMNGIAENDLVEGIVTFPKKLVENQGILLFFSLFLSRIFVENATYLTNTRAKVQYFRF